MIYAVTFIIMYVLIFFSINAINKESGVFALQYRTYYLIESIEVNFLSDAIIENDSLTQRS